MRFQEATSTAVTDLGSQSAINVYPNPASDVVYIDSDKAVDTVRLFSMNGQLLISKEGIREKSYQLAVNGLKSGLYLLQVDQWQTKLVSVR